MKRYLFVAGRQQQTFVTICVMSLKPELKLLTFTLQSCPFKTAHKYISSAVRALLSSVCVQHVSSWLTDGAVFTGPALVAVTLALPADSVVDAAWVTVPLLTFRPCPTFLTVTHATDARAVRTTVYHAHLCCKKKQTNHGDM